MPARKAGKRTAAPAPARVRAGRSRGRRGWPPKPPRLDDEREERRQRVEAEIARRSTAGRSAELRNPPPRRGRCSATAAAASSAHAQRQRRAVDEAPSAAAARGRDGGERQRQQGGVTGEQRLKQAHRRATFAKPPPRLPPRRLRTVRSRNFEAKDRIAGWRMLQSRPGRASSPELPGRAVERRAAAPASRDG